MPPLPRFLAALALASLPALGAEPIADLVIVNARIHTLNPAAPLAAAAAIAGGKFLAVGPDTEIRRLAGPATRVIDAQGRTAVPGLIETHVHPAGAARGEAQQPFTQLHSLEEIRAWTRARVREAAPGAWIRLPRVDVTRIRERRIPTRADLDAAAPRHPAVFTWQYANRTKQVLNSAALRAAGITRGTAAPPGGKIHLDADGQPTGVMDDCNALLAKFLPAPPLPDATYHDSLVQLLRRYNEIGITSITDRHSTPEGYRTYEALKADGRLPVRVTVTIGLGTDGSVAGTERAIRALPFKPGEGDDWLRVGPLKILVDGGALYGTAYMSAPYGPPAFALYGITDPNYRGDLRISPDNLKNIIRTGHRLGWQMSSHVTGDAGVDAVLDAVEAADADSPIAPRRYNLIHAYFPNPAAAQRAARLGVAVDTQPMWYFKDGDALVEALGRARLDQFIGLQHWLRAGVKVALNADHMHGFDPDTSLNPYNPFLAMQTAVTRRTEGGQVFGADQRVTRAEALRMVTIDAAWLSLDETRKGSVEPGKLGDLAILTADPLTCPEDKMREIRAVTTIVGGKVVFERAP